MARGPVPVLALLGCLLVALSTGATAAAANTDSHMQPLGRRSLLQRMMNPPIVFADASIESSFGGYGAPRGMPSRTPAPQPAKKPGNRNLLQAWGRPSSFGMPGMGGGSGSGSGGSGSGGSGSGGSGSGSGDGGSGSGTALPTSFPAGGGYPGGLGSGAGIAALQQRRNNAGAMPGAWTAPMGGGRSGGNNQPSWLAPGGNSGGSMQPVSGSNQPAWTAPLGGGRPGGLPGGLGSGAGLAALQERRNNAGATPGAWTAPRSSGNNQPSWLTPGGSSGGSLQPVSGSNQPSWTAPLSGGRPGGNNQPSWLAPGSGGSLQPATRPAQGIATGPGQWTMPTSWGQQGGGRPGGNAGNWNPGSWGGRPNVIGGGNTPGLGGGPVSPAGGNAAGLGSGSSGSGPDRPSSFRNWNDFRGNRQSLGGLTGDVQQFRGIQARPIEATGYAAPLAQGIRRRGNARSAAQSLAQAWSSGQTDAAAEAVASAATVGGVGSSGGGESFAVAEAVAETAAVNPGVASNLLARSANFAVTRGQTDAYASTMANAFVVAKQKRYVPQFTNAVADAIAVGGAPSRYAYGQAIATAIAQGGDSQAAVAEATATAFCEGGSTASSWASAYAVALSQDSRGCLVLNQAKAMAQARCGANGAEALSKAQATSLVLGFCGLFDLLPGGLNIGWSGGNSGSTANSNPYYGGLLQPEYYGGGRR